MKTAIRRVILPAAALLFLFASSMVVLVQGHRHFPNRWEDENVMYFPSGRFLEPVVLGYNQMVADFLWVRAVSYFGAHAMTDRKYDYMPQLLDAITILDPSWDFPYHFAGVVLSVDLEMVDAANKIVRRGMDALPDVWQFPFYIGFNYFHFKNNSVCGARYIFKASTYERAPKYLIALAAKLSATGNTRENHQAMCASLLNTTRDEYMRKRILSYCEKPPAAPTAQATSEECL